MLTSYVILAVLLNSPQIFEKIFSDELIMDIVGCLECKLYLSKKFRLGFFTSEICLSILGSF